LPVELIFRNRVKSLQQKYFSFPETKIVLIIRHPASARGTLRIVMSGDAGSDGRSGAQTTRAEADGKSVWS
jgi:hypothetical protein